MYERGLCFMTIILYLSSITGSLLSSNYLRKGNCTNSTTSIIAGLREQIAEDIKERNWMKSVVILRKNLCSTTTEYKQLENLQTGPYFPLHAAGYGYTSIIEVLLHNGLPVNEIIVNRCMLHEAAKYGQYETVKFLLKNGADTEVKDTLLSMPIHYAATNYHINIIELLIGHGADINARNYYGRTALHEVAQDKYINIVKLLLTNGAKANIPEHNGDTPLHWAAVDGEVNIVKLLLEYGADVNVKDLMGRTPLHRAAANNRVAIVGLLVVNGCDKSIVDKYGKTALSYATEEDHKEIVKILSKQKEFPFM